MHSTAEAGTCRCKGVDSNLPITVGMKEAMQDHSCALLAALLFSAQAQGAAC